MRVLTRLLDDVRCSASASSLVSTVTCNPKLLESDSILGPPRYSVKMSNRKTLVSDPRLNGQATDFDALKTSWSSSLRYVFVLSLRLSSISLRLCSEIP